MALAAGHQVAVPFLLQLGRPFLKQGQLTAEDPVQTAAQQGPVVAGDGEVASEVEQGLLADLA